MIFNLESIFFYWLSLWYNLKCSINLIAKIKSLVTQKNSLQNFEGYFYFKLGLLIILK
jgi:hypothetical protein